MSLSFTRSSSHHLTDTEPTPPQRKMNESHSADRDTLSAWQERTERENHDSVSIRLKGFPKTSHLVEPGELIAQRWEEIGKKEFPGQAPWTAENSAATHLYALFPEYNPNQLWLVHEVLSHEIPSELLTVRISLFTWYNGHGEDRIGRRMEPQWGSHSKSFVFPLEGSLTDYERRFKSAVKTVCQSKIDKLRLICKRAGVQIVEYLDSDKASFGKEVWDEWNHWRKNPFVVTDMSHFIFTVTSPNVGNLAARDLSIGQDHGSPQTQQHPSGVSTITAGQTDQEVQLHTVTPALVTGLDSQIDLLHDRESADCIGRRLECQHPTSSVLPAHDTLDLQDAQSTHSETSAAHSDWQSLTDSDEQLGKPLPFMRRQHVLLGQESKALISRR